jgi:hypothetical protein
VHCWRRSRTWSPSRSAPASSYKGEPPSTACLPAGCAFSNRCPHVKPACVSPALENVLDHHVACCAGRSFVRTLAPLDGAAPGIIINSITAARSKAGLPAGCQLVMSRARRSACETACHPGRHAALSADTMAEGGAFEVAGKIVDPVAIGAGQLRHVARWPIVDHRALVGAAVDQRVDAALGGPHNDDRRIA